MPYMAQFLHLIAIGIKGRRAVVGVPCGMGRVHHPVGLVERVVPQDVCIAVGNAQVVVVDVHLCRVVNLTQGDVDLLGVAHERDGVVGRLPGIHLHRLHLHAVPQRVEGQAVVVDEKHIVALLRRLQPDVERLHVVAFLRLGADEAGPTSLHLLGIGVLSGQHDELILAGIKIHVHGVGRIGQRHRAADVGLRLLADVLAVLVEHVDVDGSHVVVEHVGALKVVVILEVEIQSYRTVLSVFGHHVARCEHRCRQSCHAQPCQTLYRKILHTHIFYFLFLLFINNIHPYTADFAALFTLCPPYDWKSRPCVYMLWASPNIDRYSSFRIIIICGIVVRGCSSLSVPEQQHPASLFIQPQASGLNCQA